MRLEHAVDDGDVRAWDLVHRDVARLVPLIWRVRQEEQVPAVERGFHRATVNVCSPSFRQPPLSNTRLPPNKTRKLERENSPEDDDDRRLGVREEAQAFPDHKSGREHGHEVEDLEEHLETRQNGEPFFSIARTRVAPEYEHGGILASEAS